MKALMAMASMLLALANIGHAYAASTAHEESFWSAIKKGGHVVLIRHVRTEPGVGDPPGFTIGDCSTQRNLSAQGRADAKRIGTAFRNRAIPVDAVLSSRWCRCVDTAQLAFGRVETAPMIDSMFTDDTNARQSKLRDTASYIARYAARSAGKGNLVLVTHAVNIEALTGVSPASGEMVAATPDTSGKLKVVSRLEMPER